MSSWNRLENQLRGWKPRRPSEKVRARLFGESAVPRARLDLAVVRRVLAPGLAFVLVVLVVSGTRPAGGGWPAATNAFPGDLVLQEPALAAYLPGDRHSGQNRTAHILESTVALGSPSKAGSIWNTNSLLH